MKKNMWGPSRVPPLLFKLLAVMKLTILLILMSVCQLQAGVYGQGSITLNLQQTSIDKILNRIEKNGDFRFLYNYDLKSLKKKVDLNVTNAPIREALEKLFENTDLTYKLLENNLVVVLLNSQEKQDIRVTGKVTSATGESLPGVSIVVKGTNRGTNTDNSGAYAITAPENGVLVVSTIGFENKEVNVSGQSVINISLTASTAKLDEVVVVGYGSQRRRDVTGAVSVVTAADIANRPIVNAGEALQGKAAGVQVTSNSGKPGAGLSIRVRGASSISAGNEPLYVVDGIPMTDITALNPGDIETMTVLKDAASASIYGTRAANGVVVITTKKGIAGKSRIEFGYYYGSTSTTKKLDVLNASQYQQYMNESYGPGTITDSLVQANNINWPDEIFRNGSQANYQVSISGGNDKTLHFISLNYNDQVGMIRPATFNRVSARVNLSSKINNWFTLTSSTQASRAKQFGVTDNAGVARGGVVLSALATPPTVAKYKPDGSIGQNPLTGWENPFGAIEGRKDRSTTDRIISNLGADIRIYKGLTFQSRFGVDYQNFISNFLLDPFLTQDGVSNKGRISETKNTQLVWLSEQTLNYNIVLGKSRITALAGWTAQESRWDQTVISGTVIRPEDRLKSFNEIYTLAGTKNPAVKSIDEWALTSYLGRLTYDFDSKYLLQANIRSDRSSKFAPENRTATFPSFSAGWRISEEKFFEKIQFINDLKIRVGWGQNGNQEGIGSYQYLSLSNVNAQGRTSPATVALDDLRWETSTQTNIGLDVSFLNRRINFSADFYVKKTKDVLVNIPLPTQSGFESALMNKGSMKNIGQEFVISSRNIVNGPLLWNTDLNISFNRNEVVTIGNGISFLNAYGNIYERGNAIALLDGYELGTFYGYVAAGVDPTTGKQLYLAQDGKSVPYAEIKPSDRRLLGNAQPDFVYGMTNNLSYKNFDLTIFIQGSQGNKIFNGVRVETEGMKDSRNQSTAILGRWQNPGDITDIPGVQNASNDNTQISTRFLEDGSYLRFKTITLTYKFNSALLNKIGLGTATVYVSGQNLITITKYKGFDPEVSSYGTATDTDNRNISLGVDYGAYPQAKVFLFGVNLSLK